MKHILTVELTKSEDLLLYKIFKYSYSTIESSESETFKQLANLGLVMLVDNYIDITKFGSQLIESNYLYFSNLTN